MALPRDVRPPELEGRVAVVTGGAKGIGRLVGELLAGEGAAVVVAGRDQSAIDAAVHQLNGTPAEPSAIGIRCDVTSEEETRAMVAQALDVFGRIDILVNTAGGTGPIETPCHEYPADEFRGVLELNIMGTFLACKAVIPSMIAKRSGRIVNIAGTSGLRGYRNRSGYSASKWAVRGFTRTLALELGEYGITVNDVCPNVTNGARMDRIVTTKASRIGSTVDEVYAEFASQTALGRFVDEIDIAEAVLFLVSDRAKNITGHDIVVDAGWDV